jgi:hypothetical protein
MTKSTKYGRKNSPVERLVITLKNQKKKKDFHTVHTFNEVVDETEARRIIMDLFSQENVVKAIYNNRSLEVRDRKFLDDVLKEAQKRIPNNLKVK